MFRSAERKLTRWYLLVLAIVVGLYGAASFLLTRSELLGAVDRGNARALEHIAAEFRAGEASLDDVAHELSEIAVGPGEFVVLRAASGKMLSARGAAPDAWAGDRAGRWTMRAGRHPVRILAVALDRGGQERGYLAIGRSLQETRESIWRLALCFASLVPLALLAACLGGRFLARKAMRPVEQALDRERQLTRDASHELRTPIAAIMAQAQLALADPGMTDTTKARLDTIAGVARRLAALVSDLLTLGRGDAGLGGAAVRFDLEEVVEDELAALAPLADDRHLAITRELPDSGCWVAGEPGRIGQAVRNLLDNAIRYSPEGATVRVALSPDGPRWILTVANPGEIAPADRERIFERFARLDQGRQANPEGTGLGLAISRSVARAHGGDLSLASTDGAEATFRLALPKV